MSEISGGCHCGAVQITLAELPAEVLQCNCSLCRKTGWIGGYCAPEDAKISAGDDALIGYVQGDKTITVWHCRTCGCTTHWTPLTAPPDRMGINMRMFDWKDWKHLAVVEVDGASW